MKLRDRMEINKQLAIWHGAKSQGAQVVCDGRDSHIASQGDSVSAAGCSCQTACESGSPCPLERVETLLDVYAADVYAMVVTDEGPNVYVLSTKSVL